MPTDKRTAGAVDELQMWGQRVVARLSRHRKRLDIHSELERLDIGLDRDDSRVVRIADEIKCREARGYAYDGADASFELLARGLMGQVPRYFSVDSCDVVDVHNAGKGGSALPSEASVRVLVSGDRDPVWSIAEGASPMEAIKQALCKALGCYQKHLNDLEFADYKVSVLTRAEVNLVRVLVGSRSRVTGEHWFTVGVSPNIVDASFEALVDSINYKLMKSSAVVAHAVAS
jgi:2-isopropylmalate synthase